MDHILLLEHQYSSLKYCNPGVAKFRRSVNSSHIVIAISTIASLALFMSLSMHISLSSTLSAQLIAVGSFVMTKKVLFVLSNTIFLFLAADYRCFFTISASTSDVAAREPSDGLAEQAQHHQEADQCATQPFVSYLVRSPHHKNRSSVSDNCTHPGNENHVESRSNHGMSNNTTPLGLDEDVSMSSKLELFRLDEEVDSITLETVVIKEPTSGMAPELEKLHIDELNKKFEEFIRSRRIKWVEEQEASLQWQEKGDNICAAVLAC